MNSSTLVTIYLRMFFRNIILSPSHMRCHMRFATTQNSFAKQLDCFYSWAFAGDIKFETGNNRSTKAITIYDAIVCRQHVYDAIVCRQHVYDAIVCRQHVYDAIVCRQHVYDAIVCRQHVYDGQISSINLVHCRKRILTNLQKSQS